MLTLLASLLVMGIVWAGLHFGAQLGGWAVTLAVLAGVGVYVAIALVVRRKVGTIMTAMQTRITDRNKAVINKYQQIASRGGNAKYLMDQIRKEQDVIISEALETTRRIDGYCRWSPLLDRQVNALRVQFLYQLKRYNEVDKLLPKALLTEPVLSCMKMCREYQRGEEAALEKTYNRARKRFRANATLVYATYAWMLLKKKQFDKARQVLADGKKATEDETLERNWEHLTNDRPNQFSNADLGEMWYVLQLEEPKQPKPRVERRFRPYR